jgi:hypothetical protein
MEMRSTRIAWTLAACVMGQALHGAVGAAEPELKADLRAGVKKGIIATDPQADGGRCVVADLSQPEGQAFLAATPDLKPGVYLARLHVKISTNNSINTAPLRWTFTVGGAGVATNTFDVLAFERAGVYQELPCRLVVDRAGKAQVALSWRRGAIGATGPGVRMRVEKSELPNGAHVGDLLDRGKPLSETDVESELAEEPPLAGLKYLNMAIDKVALTPVSDVDIATLEVDKLRYNPGAVAKVAVAVRNFAPAERALRVETVFIHDLDTAIPVDQRTLKVAAGGRADFECAGPAFTEKWGYAVRSRVTDGDRLVAEKSEYFTVHSNLWAVLLSGRGPAQFTANVTRENAIAAACSNKRRYRNWVESGFWAPDEFGDFTPDTERWWGGQGCYYGSVTGTVMQIEEGHKAGIAYAVYSNIWGGDGPPAFEAVRADPETGYPSTFNVEWFERWDRNTMGTGKGGRGMHVWPITIINYGNAENFKHHGRELIEAHRTLGWDAVRYDSHAISKENARVVGIVKATVRAEVPEFQFGYNSSVPGNDPSLSEPFKAECEGEGGIMEEGIRQFGGGGMSFSGGKTYEEFAGRILSFKEKARRSGGHFIAIGMDKCYANDFVYQWIFWLASNTHPCYD